MRSSDGWWTAEGNVEPSGLDSPKKGWDGVCRLLAGGVDHVGFEGPQVLKGVVDGIDGPRVHEVMTSTAGNGALAGDVACGTKDHVAKPYG